MIKCSARFCTLNPDGTRGRTFTPPPNAQGVEAVWCSDCIKLANEVKFFTGQTANMIREKWRAYDDTNLPHNVKIFMEQFVKEILMELGEEL